jgi:hypothetical protein
MVSNTSSLLAVFSVQNTSSSTENELLKAYKENDTKEIDAYFENWNEESKKLTKSEYANKLEESLYQIYKIIFHPYNMEPLVNEQMMDYFEKDLIEVINRAPYVVVQNKINYIITNFEEAKGEDIISYIITARIGADDIKTIEEFYPLVDVDKEKVLYLTKRHEEDLTRFLGTEEQPFGKKSIMGPAIPKGETGKRYQFIRKYIPILYGHWGGYWHLSTHPQIEYVYINKELNHALAQYRIGYNFGFAELKKIDDEWIMLRAEMNGME